MIIASIIAGIVGFVLHELCHYLMAKLLGNEAYIDWWSLYTYFDYSNPVEARMIYLAPLAIGTALIPTMFEHFSLPFLMFWAVLTLGGRDDINKAIYLSDKDVSGEHGT